MRIALFALAVPVVLASWACSSSNTSAACDCAAPGARVHVPPESAAAVVEVRLSGPACAGQKATCTQQAALGCATYSIEPVAAGACTVEVAFADTTFSAQMTFREESGCCKGLYPTTPDAGDIDAVHGPADAGAAG